MSYNKVILIGNLTRDIELRYTTKGQAVARIGLAVNSWKKSDDGKEDTLFIDVDAWEKLAERCKEYLSKGSQILVEGRLKLDTWDDKETGQKRSKIFVIASDIRFLGTRNQGDSSSSSSAGFKSAKRPAEDDFNAPGNSMDDIPF